ncbi:hypothetical protein RUM43_008267 [Polyplax serrata]|uniref:Small ribosomal subunit protein mS31 n=1 Tax=Polyplax serrata TaxID=468196 RepID=A0AAN8S611_POLSC
MCNDASDGSCTNEKPVTNEVKKIEKKRRTAKKDFYVVPINHEEHMKAKSILQDLIKSEVADFPDDNSKKKVDVTTAEPKMNRKKQSTDLHKLLLDKHLVASATDVAKEFGGDVEKTKSEILSLLKDVNVFKGNHENKNAFLTFNKEEREANMFRRTRRFDSTSQQKSRGSKSSSDEVEELNIFNKLLTDGDKKPAVELKLWGKLVKAELDFLGESAPKNYYEEMIHWTKQGRLWHFPIDNEQGMDDEMKVSFSEHVFLEDQLEPWCPKGGPIRHFMELVLVGLSKNPYLSVADKHEHINWYKNYFEDKRKLLMEIGALGTQKNISTGDQPKSSKEGEEQH